MLSLKKNFCLFFVFFIGSWSLSVAQEIPLYLDDEAAVEMRIRDLMDRMTLEEKVAQMVQYVGIEHMKKAEKDLTVEEMQQSDAQGFYLGLFSHDVEKMTAEGMIGSFLHVKTAEEANYLQGLAKKSRLGIPLLIGIDAIHGNAFVEGATIYPSPISLASTWNDSLSFVIGQQTALEMRAMGLHWTFTPNIDVLRDPRWGRCGETFGEDPFLVGNMGVAHISGLQSEDFSGEDHVIACAKHLIGGGESVNGLNSAPTDLSMRTIYEMHLPPYKRAIQEAKVFSIMAAHNELNGIPCHQDSFLMTELLRKEWGFDGFYVSDWMDVGRIWHLHHAAENYDQAVIQSVSAGMDMNMHGPGFLEAVVKAVESGQLDEDRIDEACSKILEAKFRLGLFEQSMVDLDKVEGKIFTQEHVQTSLETARQSIVLLKNDGLLPIDGGKIKKIFVTGPNADNMTTLGDWSIPQPENHLITIFEGLDRLAMSKMVELDFYKMEEHSKQISDYSIQESIRRAQGADAVILVLGENSFRHNWKNKTTGENIARASLGLSGRQLELTKALHATGKDLIVIYVNGSPISEPWIQDHAQGIIEAWEPGSFGGLAVAEILFGEVNPSGKLPLTVARNVGQLQMVYNHKTSMYKHKYHDESRHPLYPFGFGLSYTNFEYSKPILSKGMVPGDMVFVSCQVSNTGDRDGDEIVQLYIRDNYSQVTRPIKELKGYKRIHLKAGETKLVQFEISPELLAYYDRDMNYMVEAGVFTLMLGSSSRDRDLQTIEFEISEDIHLNKNYNDK